MKRVWLLLVLALAGCGGERESRPSPTPAEASGETVLGVVWQGRSAGLGRFDALTLRPVGGRRTPVGKSWTVVAAPDGETLALGSAERGGLRFVDAASLRLRGRPLALPQGWIRHVLWPRRDRVLVLAQGEPSHVVTVDPAVPRVVGDVAVEGTVVAEAAAAGRIVLLLAPEGRIGPSRLAVADLEQGTRVVPLPGVLSGSERIEHEADSHAMRHRVPGLAVSPSGDRAVVVGAGSLAVEIDLDTLAVAEHELSEPVSLLGRLRGWLEPAAQAKVREGPYRTALWLGEHHVAVTGVDQNGIRDGEWDARAAGLSLVDTRDWSVRMVAQDVTSIVAAGELVLAFGGNWPEGSRGTGLRAYGPDAVESFRLFGDEAIGWIETAWPYAYVARPGGRGDRQVVDLRTGRVAGRTTSKQTVTVLAPS